MGSESWSDFVVPCYGGAVARCGRGSPSKSSWGGNREGTSRQIAGLCFLI